MLCHRVRPYLASSLARCKDRNSSRRSVWCQLPGVPALSGAKCEDILPCRVAAVRKSCTLRCQMRGSSALSGGSCLGVVNCMVPSVRKSTLRGVTSGNLQSGANCLSGGLQCLVPPVWYGSPTLPGAIFEGVLCCLVPTRGNLTLCYTNCLGILYRPVPPVGETCTACC